MLNMEKIKAIWSLFKQGESVADPAKWKARQITVTMLAGLLMAAVQLARAFGHEIPIDNETAMAIAGGAIAVFNTVFTITTSKTVGVPTRAVREAEPPVPSTEQPAEEEPAAVSPSVAPDTERGGVASTIDDDVRQRAIAWARQHSATNNLQNDA
jgi:hypothetical protein